MLQIILDCIHPLGSDSLPPVGWPEPYLAIRKHSFSVIYQGKDYGAFERPDTKLIISETDLMSKPQHKFIPAVE